MTTEENRGGGDTPPSNTTPESNPDGRTPEEWMVAWNLERSRAEANLAGWQRAQADLSNFRRRSDQERVEALKYGSIPTLLQVLTIADDLERALMLLPPPVAQLTWVEGIVLIYRKMLGTLDNAGAREIEAEGKQFDPTVHEAIAQGDGSEGQVIHVIQKGYLLQERVLRPALVQVGNGTVDGVGERDMEAEGGLTPDNASE
ncbi:MAG: nucleotide exchange factor GrpE [Chloroflexi bacterium]|nr:nucleotide exchange factor GrpE [Chloroflexota bacterium]